MCRRVISFLWALSLIVAVGSFEIWFHSAPYDRTGWTSCTVSVGQTVLRSDGGGLWYIHHSVTGFVSNGESIWIDWYPLGFAYHGGPYAQAVRIPFWWITIAALF